MHSISINWAEVGENLLRLIIAFALAMPVGWERGRGSRSVGLRTFPIVAMASCGYMLIVKSTDGVTAETQARLIQGLVAGIGFIGGGAILKNNEGISGLATAASIWNTGAIGVAIAAEREEVAIVLAIMNFFTLFLLTPIINRRRDTAELPSDAVADDRRDSPDD